jgi:serine protease
LPPTAPPRYPRPCGRRPTAPAAAAAALLTGAVLAGVAGTPSPAALAARAVSPTPHSIPPYAPAGRPAGSAADTAPPLTDSYDRRRIVVEYSTSGAHRHPTGPPGHPTTGAPDYPTTGAPGHPTTGTPGNPTIRPPGHPTIGAPLYPTVDAPGHAIAAAPPARSSRARAREGALAGQHPSTSTRVLRLPPGVGMRTALARLRRERGVVWAVPDYVAHAASDDLAHATSVSIPDDPGTGNTPGDWQQLQWNFSGPFGVNAPQAWANAAAEGAPGGSRVIVAVLDTGVAYANRGRYRRSPDFSKYTFVQGYDFIDHKPYANDHNGHGTFVAGTIAEATDNHYGLTGLAYAARIMPVRVLDGAGEGDASVIAEGVRFAVKHGARIINLSLEFSSNVGASDIPELTSALRYAYRHRVVVVAAAGNEGSTEIPYPARAPHVIAVGATTEHGCLASYSNYGPLITLVAPGGGPDASLPGDPNCSPELPVGRDIFQMTFTGSSPREFGFPGGYEGTSMATPHVTATVALILAAGILGRNPTPARVTARLKATARKLGDPQDQALYGAGLLDTATATAPGGAGAT